MISNFNLDYKLEKSTNARITKKTEVTDINHGITLKVFVKKYMAGIKFGEPTKTPFRLNKKIFANKNKTKPKFSRKLVKEQNYITATYRDEDFNIDRITKLTKGKSEEYGTKIKKAIIPKGTILRMKFLNGKISKPVVTTGSITQKFKTANDERISTVKKTAITLHSNNGDRSIPKLKKGGATIQVINKALTINNINKEEIKFNKNTFSIEEDRIQFKFSKEKAEDDKEKKDFILNPTQDEKLNLPNTKEVQTKEGRLLTEKDKQEILDLIDSYH